VVDLYVAAAGREIDLAEARGALAPPASQTMRELLAAALQAPSEPVP
jgi:hypothetical protein